MKYTKEQYKPEYYMPAYKGQKGVTYQISHSFPTHQDYP